MVFHGTKTMEYKGAVAWAAGTDFSTLNTFGGNMAYIPDGGEFRFESTNTASQIQIGAGGIMLNVNSLKEASATRATPVIFFTILA